MQNIDLKAALAAHQILDAAFAAENDTDQVENLITKALGIVQESGVYAATLFLLSRRAKPNQKDGRIAKACLPQLLSLGFALIGSTRTFTPESAARDVLGPVASEICSDLDRLLLVKSVWEQTLIYCRYGAKSYA
jgi:hypothetical protein